jgi:DNA-binding HxlR family transcriptional regulator
MTQPTILGIMQRTSFETMNCSVAQCLEVVGEWWSMLIVRDAFLGVRRFDDFQARLGISRNILTTRLTSLVEAGVLQKVPYQERPLRHEYRLTEKGHDLWSVLTAMREWGDRWSAPDGAPLEVVHDACGEVLVVAATCRHCGEAVDHRSGHVRPGPGASPNVQLTGSGA